MQNDADTPAVESLSGRLDADHPGASIAPPPPMPVVTHSTGAVSQASTASVPPPPPAAQSQSAQPDAATGGWEVDSHQLNAFASAIDLVRDRLHHIHTLVDAMQSASYTPKLGTSPVAVQLEQKFADRLDTPVDNPQRPTTGGLRPMLGEAMRRMEEFVAGAAAAARDYLEHDLAAADYLGQQHQHHHHHHRGG
jgi:hypothetical protein